MTCSITHQIKRLSSGPLFMLLWTGSSTAQLCAAVRNSLLRKCLMPFLLHFLMQSRNFFHVPFMSLSLNHNTIQLRHLAPCLPWGNFAMLSFNMVLFFFFSRNSGWLHMCCCHILKLLVSDYCFIIISSAIECNVVTSPLPLLLCWFN